MTTPCKGCGVVICADDDVFSYQIATAPRSVIPVEAPCKPCATDECGNGIESDFRVYDLQSMTYPFVVPFSLAIPGTTITLPCNDGFGVTRTVEQGLSEGQWNFMWGQMLDECANQHGGSGGTDDPGGVTNPPVATTYTLRLTCCDGVTVYRQIPTSTPIAEVSGAVNPVSNFIIRASAGGVNLQKAFSITFSDPVITTDASQFGAINVAYSLTLQSSGFTNPVWSITVGTLPTGLALNPATGVISGTPTLDETKVFTVSVLGGGNTDTKQITLEIRAAQITNDLTLTNGISGVAISVQFLQQGLLTPVTWFIEGITKDGIAVSSISGLALVGATGVYSGTTTTEGLFQFKIKVSSNADPTAFISKIFNLRITPPVLLPETLPDAPVGVAYSQQIVPTGFAGPYIYTSGSLPLGLSMSSTGLISGTPTFVSPVTFVVSVEGSALQVQREYTIDVTGAGTSEITTVSPLADAVEGVAYSQALSQTGLSSPTWSVVAGALPAGLSLNSSTGVISGTPTIPATTGSILGQMQQDCTLHHPCPTPGGGGFPPTGFPPILNCPSTNVISLSIWCCDGSIVSELVPATINNADFQDVLGSMQDVCNEITGCSSTAAYLVLTALCACTGELHIKLLNLPTTISVVTDAWEEICAGCDTICPVIVPPGGPTPPGPTITPTPGEPWVVELSGTCCDGTGVYVQISNLATTAEILAAVALIRAVCAAIPECSASPDPTIIIRGYCPCNGLIITRTLDNTPTSAELQALYTEMSDECTPLCLGAPPGPRHFPVPPTIGFPPTVNFPSPNVIELNIWCCDLSIVSELISATISDADFQIVLARMQAVCDIIPSCVGSPRSGLVLSGWCACINRLIISVIALPTTMEAVVQAWEELNDRCAAVCGTGPVVIIVHTGDPQPPGPTIPTDDTDPWIVELFGECCDGTRAYVQVSSQATTLEVLAAVALIAAACAAIPECASAPPPTIYLRGYCACTNSIITRALSGAPTQAELEALFASMIAECEPACGGNPHPPRTYPPDSFPRNWDDPSGTSLPHNWVDPDNLITVSSICGCDGHLVTRSIPSVATSAEIIAAAISMAEECIERCPPTPPGSTFPPSLPGGIGPGGVPIPVHIYGSAPAQCIVSCPDGAQFTYRTRAGAFAGTSQQAADAAANAAVCQLASANRICLTALPQSICADVAFSQTIQAQGLSSSPQNIWSITGTLPTGLSASGSQTQNLIISGTPTAAGTFNFQVSVVTPSGSSIFRNYSVTVAQIIPATSSFFIGVPFSQQMTLSAGPGSETWTVASGSLPDGITMTSGGLISGTPTSTSAFSFTLQAIGL